LTFFGDGSLLGDGLADVVAADEQRPGHDEWKQAGFPAAGPLPANPS